MIDNIVGTYSNFSFLLIINSISLVLSFLNRRIGFFNQSFWEPLVYSGFIGAVILIIFNLNITDIFDVIISLLLILMATFPTSIFCIPGFLIGSIIGEFLPKQISFVLPSPKSSQDPGVILQQYCKKVNEAWQSNGIDDEILPKETERVFIAYINGLQKNDDSIKFLKRLHSPPCLKWMDDIQAAALNKVKEFGLNELL